jgi:hypothetical protein
MELTTRSVSNWQRTASVTQAETWQIVGDMGNNLSETVSEIAQQWYTYSAVDPNVNTDGQLNFGGTQPVDL